MYIKNLLWETDVYKEVVSSRGNSFGFLLLRYKILSQSVCHVKKLTTISVHDITVIEVISAVHETYSPGYILGLSSLGRYKYSVSQ